jgi:predicted SPOUT superfamily RNA methylase MTH1
MNGVFNTFLRVVLPTSILSVEHHLLLKSIRIHQVARWTSIFGVSEVLFYREPTTSMDEFREHELLIKDHWDYFFTPPYLRRKLVPIKPSLKYVGMLPPIRLEVFNVDKKPRDGELRIGYVYRGRDGFLALIGDKAPYVVETNCPREGLVVVRVKNVERRLVECVDIPIYTGPRLIFTSSFREALEESRASSDVVVATDRNGKVVSVEDVVGIRGRRVSILFGSPKYDLFEIAMRDGLELRDHVDYVWNTIPGQRVVSIRTEEALIITLGVINAFLRVM